MTADANSEGFDARQFWEERLTADYSLSGVGYAGLGKPFNDWMYRVRRAVFRREMRRLLTSPQDTDVLDIGSGTGFYIGLWKELGVRTVSGSDITAKAVSELERRYPRERFVRFDVGAASTPPFDSRFDVVSAFDVLFHVVDDEAFKRAFRNVFELLEPGGVFVFSDNLVHHRALRLRHHVSREIEVTMEAVTSAGFLIERRTAMFALMNQPVDSTMRLHHDAWRRLEERLRERPEQGHWIGGLLYPLELTLTRLLREGPSTELVICRRPEISHPSSTR